MRAQGQDRFTGQANWRAGRVGSATEQVIAAISEENRRAVPEPRCRHCGDHIAKSDPKNDWFYHVDGPHKMRAYCYAGGEANTWLAAEPGLVDRGIIPNSQNKPKYGVMQIFEIALMCEVCLVIGFFIGRWLTHAH